MSSLLTGEPIVGTKWTIAEERERIRAGLLPWQWEVYTHPARFRVVFAGRRSGKTHWELHEVIRAAQRGPGRKVLYVGPSYKQAKKIFWRPLINAIPPSKISDINRTELFVEIAGYKSMIWVAGADNADALRGEGYDFVAIDEGSDIDPHVWPEIIRPALSDRKGEAIFAGTPKGPNWLAELWSYGADPANRDWYSHEITSAQAGIVDKEEIEEARRNLSPQQFEQEYEARVLMPGGRVYSNFMRNLDVSQVAEMPENYQGPLYIGMDFNVDPMTAVIGIKAITDNPARDGVHWIVHEILLSSAHTAMMAEEINRLYRWRGTPDREINIYPDPSGRARKTSASSTDFQILKDAGFKVFAPQRTPPVRDRINTMQAFFQTSAGARRIKIHPRCKKLIESLEWLCYLDSGDVNKRTGHDHLPDALSYKIWFMYPMVRRFWGDLGMTKLSGV